MSNFDNIINKFSNFILHVTEIIGENEIVDNVNKLSEIEKIEIIKKFNDFITPNNFNHFLNKKIKLFSHKNSDTLKISESLFGSKLSLKKIFNNQDDTIKLVLWEDLHSLVLYYNQYIIDNNLDIDNTAENKISKLNLQKNVTKKLIKENLNKILDTDNLNDTTNNMINDIFNSFQNPDNLKNGNPFSNIFELSKNISEKYQDKITSGDINLDDLLKNMSKLPGMGSISSVIDKISTSVSEKNVVQEPVIIDENFSTANIDIGKPSEDTLLSKLNLGSVLKTLDTFNNPNTMSDKSMPNMADPMSNMMNMFNDENGMKNILNLLNTDPNNNIDVNQITEEMKKMFK